jgi:hypothetical protein
MKAAFVLTLMACDAGSGFEGTYETISIARGACDATPASDAIAPSDQFFKLADTDELVAYYACTDVASCDDLYDLTRSFGEPRWTGTLATAIPGATCALTYRVRVLTREDDGIHIATRTYRTMEDAPCTSDEARLRGTSMPCVEQSLQIAKER